MTLDYFKIYRYNFYPFPFLYLLQNFESHSSKLSIFLWKNLCNATLRNSMKFREYLNASLLAIIVQFLAIK